MRPSLRSSLPVWAAALALTAFTGVLVAQDGPTGAAGAEAAPAAATTEAPATDASATAAPAAAEASGSAASTDAAAGGEAAIPAAAPVRPRDAEIFALATRGLMLDVVNTGKHLIAVGDRGTILASNNGKDWAQVKAPVRSALTAVAFADAENGWAVGHDAVIVKTSDGGKTWALQNFQPELEKPFLDVIATDASNALAIGAFGLMMKTADGGTTWTTVDTAVLGDETFQPNLDGIAKLGNRSLLLVGEQGTIGLSADGGATWTKIKSPYEGSLYGALAQGDTGAMIFGLRGNVFTSADVKGTPFEVVKSNTVASFFGGTALPGGGEALVGLSGMVMKLGAGGDTQQVKVKIKELDGYGKEQEKDITGSFSSAVPFGGGLVVVGEQGVQSIKLN